MTSRRHGHRTVAPPVRELLASGRERLPRWAGAVLVGALVSALGVTVAAATGLTGPDRPTGAPATAVSRRAPLPAYDRSRGAAPTIRAASPARSVLIRMQRHHELATTQQAVTDIALRSRADRRQALRQSTRRAATAGAVITGVRDRRRIVAPVSSLLTERLREVRAAAAAEVRQRRAAGSQPPTTTVPNGAVGPAAMPITGGVIGARFGSSGFWSRYHTGVDFRAPYGAPVHAAVAGVVVFAGNTGDWAGNHVAVRHADGYTTMYCHLSSITVAAGGSVTAGQPVGLVGQSGRAFGPHLHFEVYPPGVAPGRVYRAIDPVPWLASRGLYPYLG